MNVDLASSDTISLGGLGKETEFDRRKKKKSVLLSLNYDLHNSYCNTYILSSGTTFLLFTSLRKIEAYMYMH